MGGFPRSLPVSRSTAEAVRADRPAYVDSFFSACLPETDAGPLHRWGVETLLPAGPEAAVRMTAAHAGVVPDLAAVSVPILTRPLQIADAVTAWWSDVLASRDS